MQIKLILLVVLTGSVLITSAQEAKQEQPVKKGCSCSFSSINQAGATSGSRGAVLLLQSVNGIKYKTWFAGIGLGFDQYYRSGVPVFLDLRKDILDNSKTPFVYADAGVHLILNKRDDLNTMYNMVYDNGSYTDVGAGFKWGDKSNMKWLISAGYSYKYVENTLVYDRASCPRCGDAHTTYQNYLHRFSLKLGLQF
jgi:hypothetical protein